MEEFFIVRIKKYHLGDEKFIVSTWEIVEEHIKSLEEALDKKHFLSDPADFFIVIPYYS